ncbi:hypothetical protein KBY93_03260 [Synechococcus sp. J7-Johnson]|uniref:hypothetical protein n=1 Tax=Synechococcus sp. J7-Johnson TaxID=2823737 RepID=UPI0020CD433B|nr:hypothetical protein [Synechococcus sp. J7-Johnson]MCP9839653.1 hypothetical protein [Synechococcus sp. J7-Johnson]
MTLTLPRWKGLPPAPRLGPLPITSALIALLVLAPASQLHRFPRSNAEGLERVVGMATLVQSFQSGDARPVPLLWQERLGAESATLLWTRQRGTWWQFWGREGSAHLVVPARLFGPQASAPLPGRAVRVDDLVVIAPDPLSFQTLQQELRRTARTPRGLEQRCVNLLRSSQAVVWTKLALAQISGDLAPLLQRFQQGCLTVSAEADGLSWQGEASAKPDSVATSPSLPPVPSPSREPLPPDLLLEVAGARLDLLLDALLSNAVIRQPLMDRYGLDQAALERLQNTPFLLRLRPQPKGPFQASLELQLAVGQERSGWTRWLSALGQALERQGLSDQLSPSRPENAAGNSAAATAGRAKLASSLWLRDDGTPLGGWRWVVPTAGGAPELLFVLGAGLPGAERFAPARPPAGGGLSLRARPESLAALGLLPPDLPAVVRRSTQLEILSAPAAASKPGASPGGDAGLSWLWGSLRLAAPKAPAAATTKPAQAPSAAPVSQSGSEKTSGRETTSGR